MSIRGRHLTIQQRQVIQQGIENGAANADIARTIGKDATTVAKEIKSYREIKARSWKIEVCYETGRITSYQHRLRGLESIMVALSFETVKRRSLCSPCFTHLQQFDNILCSNHQNLSGDGEAESSLSQDDPV